MLSAAKRRRIAARAARDLKRKSVSWIEGRWIWDEESGEACDPGGASMGSVRKWWRDHGFSTFNKECGVCLEGALLVSMIQDPDIPDDVRASELLTEFQNDILTVCDTGFGSIVELNDSGLAGREYGNPEEVAIQILEAAGRDPNPGQLTIE